MVIRLVVVVVVVVEVVALEDEDTGAPGEDAGTLSLPTLLLSPLVVAAGGSVLADPSGSEFEEAGPRGEADWEDCAEGAGAVSVGPLLGAVLNVRMSALARRTKCGVVVERDPMHKQNQIRRLGVANKVAYDLMM